MLSRILYFRTRESSKKFCVFLNFAALFDLCNVPMSVFVYDDKLHENEILPTKNEMLPSKLTINEKIQTTCSFRIHYSTSLTTTKHVVSQNFYCLHY